MFVVARFDYMYLLIVVYLLYLCSVSFLSVCVCVCSTPLIGSTVDQGVRLYEAAGEEIKATYPISIIQNLQSGVDAVKEDPALVVSAIVDAVYYRSPAPNTYPGYQAKFIIVLNKYLPASIQFFIERGISRLLSSGPNKEVVTKLQQ